MVNKKNTIQGAKKVALVALLSALLEGGKSALAVLPNIEVVTLFCALYGYAFGTLGLFSVLIFVGVEIPIWGVGTWIISYFIHFPIVCIVFILLLRKKIKNRFIITLVAVLLTACFGVLTSLVDVGLFSSDKINFWTRFSILYLRGISFYAVQISCNLVLFLFAFTPLRELLEKLKKKYFS